MSFSQVLAQRLSADPQSRSLTLIQGPRETEYSCRDLESRIADYCRLYKQRNTGQGEIVLVVLKESLDLFASFLAGIISGVLPAFFAYPSPKHSLDAFLASIQNLVKYNNIRLLVTFPEIISVLQTHASSARGRLQEYVSFEEVQRGDASTWEIPSEVGEEAFLQFSSGTTGAKKGVRISCQALLNQIRAYGEFVQYDEGSKVVSWLPHYHDMDLIACMLMPLLSRIPIYMMSPFEWVRKPSLLLEAITKHGCTHLWLPNFALGHLTRSIPEDSLTNYDLSSVRQLVCCSEPILYETVAAFVAKFGRCGFDDRALYNCYAMAENTFAMTSTSKGPIPFLEVSRERFLKDHLIEVSRGGRRIACAGMPLRNTEVRIVDSQGGPLGEDHVGEIIIRSDCMLDSYHNNPEATRDALSGDWFKTGDLGFLDSGQLYITGRKKDLIIVGGENVYPQDIELILNAEPGLIPGRNVVFGVEDERIGTEKIVVLAETENGAQPPNVVGLQKKIFDELGVSIADILFLPPMTLRKSTAGKISRTINRDEYVRGAYRQESSVKVEDGLRDIVQRILPGGVRAELRPSTPLMSSGLIDSLSFVHLVVAIEKAYGITVPEAYLMERRFETLECIEQTIQAVRTGGGEGGRDDEEEEKRILASRGASLEKLASQADRAGGNVGFWEHLVNRCPVHSSFLYRMLFRLAGIRVGRNVVFLDRVHVKLRGNPQNILIGNDVIFGKNASLRIRENGRIVLEDRVYLDDDVRLVAARDGMIQIGCGAELGRSTVINSGGITRIGRFAMIASSVSINSSTHGVDRRHFIKDQPHRHSMVEIGDDVWIGANAGVLMDAKIGEGAIIAANSVVGGTIPPFAICMGAPARVLRYR